MKDIILEVLREFRFDNETEQETEFKKYRRTNVAEMKPYVEGEELPEEVSVSKADLDNGSPKEGDMIARNPENHDDMWLVAKDYFEDNFEEITDEEEGVKDELETEIED